MCTTENLSAITDCAKYFEKNVKLLVCNIWMFFSCNTQKLEITKKQLNAVVHEFVSLLYIMVYHSVTALLWISQQHVWQIRVRPLCLALFFIVAFYSLAGPWAGNEMGSVFSKKWKMGGVLVKKRGLFLNAGCIMYSISIFYFTFCLFGTPTHPPAPTGLSSKRSLYSRTIHHIQKTPTFYFWITMSEINQF